MNTRRRKIPLTNLPAMHFIGGKKVTERTERKTLVKHTARQALCVRSQKQEREREREREGEREREREE
jgi:hypothetical protein